MREALVLGYVAIVLGCGGGSKPSKLELAGKFAASYPKGWAVAKAEHANTTELEHPGRGAAHARVVIMTEKRRDHVDALQRLGDIAFQSTARPTFLTIGGWPAFQRREVIDMPRPGLAEEAKEMKVALPPKVLLISIAVAAGDVIVYVEGNLLPEAGDTLGKEVEAIGRSLTFPVNGDAVKAAEEIKQLQGRAPPAPAPVPPPVPPPVPAPPGVRPGPTGQLGVSTQVQVGNGELEIAASANGQTLFAAANSGHARSTDGGSTYTALGAVPVSFPRDGDPSLAVGQTGTFYYAFIGFPTAALPAGTAVGCTHSIMTSPGTTFTYLSNSVVCPNTASGSTQCLPDQEHIAADRLNAAPGGDQVYDVWRQFSGTSAGGNCLSASFTSVNASIVCSQNGGSTWTAPLRVNTSGFADFPRASVGPDGSVYVVYVSTGNSIQLAKFSSCATGLTPQVGFPVTVGTYTTIPCPVPGLDRCNDGNNLASPTVAADELDPNHVYVAYATNTITGITGNDDVIVRDSMNGGSTWPRNVRVNTVASGRRFMPWMCVLGGRAHVGWYDRRNATATTNDLTAYYRGSVAVKAGALVAGTEVSVSGIDDAQCASGWGSCRPRSTQDSDCCSTQPQLAGRCSTSVAACDFSDVSGVPAPCASGGGASTCSAGATCQAGNGCPKYGDYNGIACAGGRVFTSWASATPPPGATGVSGSGIRLFEDASFAPDEMFVRDFTLSATSFDNGPEPSTQTVIWETSDVWSRQTDAPGPLTLTTAPTSELAKRSANPAVLNYAFVRVSRRTPAAQTLTDDTRVTANFFYADYGAGLNFVAAGTAPAPVLVFTATDSTKVLAAGYPWHLPDTTSQHVCLAVEISAAKASAPGVVFDAPIAPSIMSAGAGGATDARMREDNNKAQRNLDTTLVTGTGVGEEAEVTGYAQIHNPDVERRDLRLLVEVDPAILRKLGNARVGVVGGKSIDLAAKGELPLEKMEPGERRWIGATIKGAKATQGDTLPLSFTLLLDGRAIGGFTMALRVAALAEIAAHHLVMHQGEMARLAAAFGIQAAAEEAAATERFLKSVQDKQGYRIDEKAYLEFLSARAASLHGLIEPLARDKKNDFDLAAAAARLARAVSQGKGEAVAAAHSSFLAALDATQTRLQRDGGDVADIPQILRWQEKVLSKLPGEPAKLIASRSAVWLAAYDKREGGLGDYPKLVSGLIDAYAKLAGSADPGGEAAKEVAAMKRSMDSPAALEGAHRRLLLRLRDVAK